MIDKNANGARLGNRALELGWSVVTMPENYEDANDVLQKLGKIWLVSHSVSTAVTGFEGKLLLKLKC